MSATVYTMASRSDDKIRSASASPASPDIRATRALPARTENEAHSVDPGHGPSF